MGTDYIHGNFCGTPKNPKRFICTQVYCSRTTLAYRKLGINTVTLYTVPPSPWSIVGMIYRTSVTYRNPLQGPLPTTIVDFWSMVWQEGSEFIVMLCNFNEMGKVKVL